MTLFRNEHWEIDAYGITEITHFSAPIFVHNSEVLRLEYGGKSYHWATFVADNRLRECRVDFLVAWRHSIRILGLKPNKSLETIGIFDLLRW